MPSPIRGIRTTGLIDATGPFFQRDPVRTYQENVQTMMAAVAAEGETEYRARIRSIPPAGVRTGRTRAKILGRTTSTSGRRWKVTAVIGIPRIRSGPDPIATYAALAEIEQMAHPRRATARALRKSRAVNARELTRGL